MNHKDLRDHMEGSFLQKHYLDAFLLQSTYIEGLLKLYSNYLFYTSTNGKSFDDPLLTELLKRIEKYSFGQTIGLFEDSKVIPKAKAEMLRQYTSKRNRIIHHLIKEVKREELDNELRDVFLIGKQLITSDEFKDMIHVVDVYLNRENTGQPTTTDSTPRSESGQSRMKNE